MSALLNHKTRPMPRYCNCFHCIGEDRGSGQNRPRDRRSWRREYEQESAQEAEEFAAEMEHLFGDDQLEEGAR